MMRIAALTSSRADYGIILPLLKKLRDDDSVDLSIVVFGTHLSYFHGHTIDQIEADGFSVAYQVPGMVFGNSEEAVATSMGLTITKFSTFWADHHTKFDTVLCTGDRFEMFAAVSAGIPYNIKFAHFHGGEKTMGAIDNIFRHAISHASTFHFTSTETYANRLREMLDATEHIYNVGALSLDNIQEIGLFTAEEFQEKWGIDLRKPSVLVTFHPETVYRGGLTSHPQVVSEVVQQISGKYQVLITMPNVDSGANDIRDAFIKRFADNENVYLVENLGTRGYFTAMKMCKCLVGNTSSGIIEAASFGKYVINLGDRQLGRVSGDNVIHAPISKKEILDAFTGVEQREFIYSGDNIYWNGGASDRIINILKNSCE